MKERAAYLCNLKLALIVLVVLGHSLEQTGGRGSLLYRIIYLFHMPAFAFVSGLFLKSKKQCLRQGKTALTLYLPAQGAALLFQWFAGQALHPLVPFWHLWYLLSLCWWSLLAWLCLALLRRFPRAAPALFLISAAAALLSGMLPAGRVLSLSRTLAFFPYVLLGLLCPEKLADGPGLRHRAALAAAGLAGLIPAAALLSLAPTAFLYRADSYAALALTAGEGMLLRGLCLPSAVGMGALLLALIPARRLSVSAIGGDTLPAYLLHVLFLPPLALFWPGWSPVWLAVFSFGVVLVLWELGRWPRQLYTLRHP